MKKIIYLLILLLTFNDVLYSKTQVECGDVIEVKKHAWYFDMKGEYYYNSKKILREYEFRDIFNCINNDEVNRLSYIMDTWGGIGYLSAMFFAISFYPSIALTIGGIHNKSTKISWSITGGLLLLNMISASTCFYYQEKAIDTYNRIIMDKKNIIDDKSSKYMYNKNLDIFSLSYTHKLDF